MARVKEHAGACAPWSEAALKNAMARVFISYKRDATPDQDLAHALYKALKATHEVIIDAVERIDEEIHHADIFIALLSPFSINCDTSLAQLERAHALQADRGRPLLLPIRVAYHGRLPPPLSGSLRPINCVLWEGPEDTPHLPEQVAKAMSGGGPGSTAPRAKSLPAASSTGEQQGALRVFISCRGDAAEDLKIAASFYESLSVAGVSPFLAPRSIASSEHWFHGVNQALRSCDVFLLLLSRQAMVSGMVAAEFEVARQLNKSSPGRPHILPVRVQLPAGDEQGHSLQPLQEQLQDLEQAAWSGPQDTQAIVEMLLIRTGHRARARDTVRVPPPTAPSLPAASRDLLELPGAVVSSKSPYYVARPSIEERCHREVMRPGGLIRIKGPKQTGKTSLMMEIADHAARAGSRTVAINLQLADGAILADQDRLLRWLCAVATRRLKRPMRQPEEQWDGIFGAKDNCTAYFEEHLLAEGPPLVLLLDHVDRVFESSATAEEFLGMLRAWHEMGKSQPPWDKLRMVLGYSTEIYLPLQINHSPFNVGLAVGLSEWDADTVHELARRHELSWSRSETEPVMGLLGGHPYLIRLAMYHVANGTSLAGVLATAATDEGLFADHLKHLLWHLQSRPDLREAARRVMTAGRPISLSTELGFKLVSLGLVRLQGNELLPARNLYQLYFPSRLSNHNQRVSYDGY